MSGGSTDGGGGDPGPDGCTPSEELCDGIDNDCDGKTDEEDATDIKTWYEDKDGDNYGVSGSTKQACNQTTGWAPDPGDCDDGDPAFHPGALETNCDDPNDYNCDGSTGFTDADNDGYPACKECDDTNKDIFPGAPELCDGEDNDCDGSMDFPGGEGDGDGDGSIACEDCDDGDNQNYPGNTEKCDGQDNDCNGQADFAGGEIDQDGDSSYTCEDCDDNDKDNYPGNTEMCDGQDNNCDGQANFPGGEANGDGDPVAACLDCDDADPERYPGNPEKCDGKDNDCNASTWASGLELDNDSDGSLSCVDCNDNDNQNFPGNPEKCDGKDNNCNMIVDQSEVPVNVLCPNPPQGTATCNGAQGCEVQSCTANYYDVNGTYTDGCECQAAPSPAATGSSCASAINVGTLADLSAATLTVSGNIPFAGREIWYTFNATDDADSNGDEFHVDVRFLSNPGNGYRVAVYRSGCPGAGGTQICSSGTSVDWYTDQNYTSTGCGSAPPCGEGNCASPPQAGKSVCNNNGASFYVRVFSVVAPTCSQYTIEMSNGKY